MKKWIERWKSPTSEDFKQLKKTFSYVGGTMFAMIGVEAVLPIDYPDWLIKALSYGVMICVGVVGTSQFTKQS
jgi:hypothetical protein